MNQVNVIISKILLYYFQCNTSIAELGDALVNPEKTFKTFELVREKAPDLKLCLSNNGLELL